MGDFYTILFLVALILISFWVIGLSKVFEKSGDVMGYYDDIMWGDSGVANFFINKDDLYKKDFNNVLYNWDCY